MVEALPNFDVALEEARAERELANISSIEDYRLVREALVSYNTDQMITNLGERFNVILSTYQYEIKDGQLWGKDMDEPAINSFKRGRDYRREHGNPVDFRREEAEVVNFGKIQSVMVDENTPEGTIMLSISPQGLEGSTYKNRFMDIHTKKIDKGRRIFVESQRVSSGLSIEETKEKAQAFADIKIDDSDPAASFLEQPIIIGKGLTPEDIKFYFYREHDYMDEKTFDVVKKSVAHLTTEYAESLVKNPLDRDYHRLLFNAILNKADEVAEMIKTEGLEAVEKVIPLPTIYHIRQEIQDYGYKQVKEIMAGCGISGGYDLTDEQGDSPSSVSEFDPKKDKILCCTCPFCKEKVEAKIAKGKIECPNCKKSAKWSD
jgi:hypothetical protein